MVGIKHYKMQEFVANRGNCIKIGSKHIYFNKNLCDVLNQVTFVLKFNIAHYTENFLHFS